MIRCTYRYYVVILCCTLYRWYGSQSMRMSFCVWQTIVCMCHYCLWYMPLKNIPNLQKFKCVVYARVMNQFTQHKCDLYLLVTTIHLRTSANTQFNSYKRDTLLVNWQWCRFVGVVDDKCSRAGYMERPCYGCYLSVVFVLLILLALVEWMSEALHLWTCVHACDEKVRSCQIRTLIRNENETVSLNKYMDVGIVGRYIIVGIRLQVHY